MRRLVAVVLTAVFLVSLLAPLGAAGPVPALYFMKRADATNLENPLAPTMTTEQPTDEAPMVHPIALGTSDLPSITWGNAVASDASHRLFGPAFVGLWHAPIAANDGNLTAVLFEESDGGERTELTRTSVHINTTFGPDDAPDDPATLLPPDPSDPQAAAFYLVAQALPILLEPPVVLDLGFVDHEVTAGSSVVLGLYLEADEAGNVPAGTVPVEYDATLAPTFLYLPWYEVPEQQEEQKKPTPTDGGSNGSGTGDGGSHGDGAGADDEPQASEPEEESPGVGLVALLALIGIAGHVARRGRRR